MLIRPALPDYAKPPVSEVALSIQFAQIDKLRTYHSGLLWQSFKDDLPSVIEQASMPPNFEVFGTQLPAIAQVQFQLLSTPPLPRYWFVSKDETELLQVQQDRLIYNWREREGAGVYPRYEYLRSKLISATERFTHFISEGDLGEIQINQAEITYVNQIFLEDKDPRECIEEILTIWRPAPRDSFLPHVEDENLYFRYLLEDDEGKPTGRLHVTAHGIIRQADHQPGLQIQLVARGIPRDQSIEAAIEWLDYGRAVIVKKFTDLTTKKMHKRWGRTDVDE
jgi:uncharacterized protein (TIGR04255 family)